ncbi:MAG: TlpA disulfide reductase family protein [Proteobacteria bacterium]|nr:TlpA disulfide reductase family protein [Pseudomonadota bacterium]
MRLLSMVACAVLSVSASAGYGITEGEVMPSVEIKSNDGVSNIDWKGKVTVLNFWATWCDACKIELKEMSTEFSPLHERKDVLVGYVSLDKDPDKARKYLQDTFGLENPVTKRIGHDASFSAADQLGIDSFPMTLIIDRAGKVVKVQRGFKAGAGSTTQLLKTAQGL